MTLKDVHAFIQLKDFDTNAEVRNIFIKYINIIASKIKIMMTP